MARVPVTSRSFSIHFAIEEEFLTSMLKITDTDSNVISWHATRSDPLANIPTANVLAKLKLWHFEMNTTRGLTLDPLISETCS